MSLYGAGRTKITDIDMVLGEADANDGLTSSGECDACASADKKK